MKRYDFDIHADYSESTDGGWIRYSDHVEDMKRIAGEGRANAELTDAAKEAINVAIELITVHYGRGWSTHVNVLRDLLDGPSFAKADPSASSQQDPDYWQWRKKGQPWSLERTFVSRVHATTDDSEVRPLYAAPADQEPCGMICERGQQNGKACGIDCERDIERDAARYRWLKGQYLAADFDWQGQSVLVFKFPRNAAVSADCDDTIDRGMSATPPAAE